MSAQIIEFGFTKLAATVDELAILYGRQAAEKRIAHLTPDDRHKLIKEMKRIQHERRHGPAG